MCSVFEPDVRTVRADVGGFCWCGGSPSVTKVALDRKQYGFGERVQVTLNCNNSACSKDIRAFKVMLLMRYG